MTERNKIHVCHYTSVHNADDIRIFKKECVSLAKAGYKITLIAPGTKNEIIDGVTIIGAGNRPSSRMKRMLFFAKHVLELARRTDADVYHFHDPELLQGAWDFIRNGKKIIYDSHEDVPKQIKGKYWINPLLRVTVSRTYKFFEDLVVSKLSGIVTATPFINERFIHVNPYSIAINNFPSLKEFEKNAFIEKRENYVCYVGGLTEIRGIKEIIRAIGKTQNVRLILAGSFSPASFEGDMRKEKGWDKVDYYGLVNRKVMAEILAKSKAGIVTFYPLPNHVDAQPNKMFEYMSASLPVIASDFPLWREIIIGNNCGMVVDPMNPDSIAEAIMKLVGDEKLIEELGKNGREAVLNKYNWEAEEIKLIEFYDKLAAE